MPTSPKRKPAPVGVLRPGAPAREWAAQNPEYEPLPSALTQDPKPASDTTWLKPYEGQYLGKPYTPVQNWVAEPLAPSVQWSLFNSGWQVEKPKEYVSSVPEDWFEKKDAKDLTDYSYRLSADEYDRLQKEYGAKPSIKTAPVVVNEGVQAVKMTRDAYLKLSDEQRAAVDFNTLLVDARERDLQSPEPELNDEQRAEYDKRVEAIFGAGNGSERVAENTLKLLENALKANSGSDAGKIRSSLIGQDLDDFLSLEAAIDTSKLKDFKLPPMPVLKPRAYTEMKMVTPPDPLAPPPQPNTPPSISILRPDEPKPMMDPNQDPKGLYTAARGAANRDLAAGLVIREMDAKLTAALTDPKVIAPTRAGVRDLVFNPAAPALPIGFAPPGSPAASTRSPEAAKKEAQFQDFYVNGLMNPAAKNLDPLWMKFKQAGYSEDDIDEFWTYVDGFTKYEMRTQADRGASNRRSAKDIRKFAGLEN